MFKLIIALSLFVSNLAAHELSLCAIFRDEAEFLEEWIVFHQLQGVDHFYLYNNLSRDNFREVIKSNKNITLIDWDFESTNLSEWNLIQCAAYNDCLLKYGNTSNFIAFLDTDEFLFCPDGRKIKDFLINYSNYSGVAVNWVFFGTNNVYKIPDNALLIETLTKRAPINYDGNKVIKTIVRTSSNACFKYDPHLPVVNGFIVNENFWQVHSPVNNPICIQKIRINHYWTRTEDFLLNKKIPRQDKWGNSNKKSILECKENINKETDKTILQFVPKLKSLLMHIRKMTNE